MSILIKAGALPIGSSGQPGESGLTRLSVKHLNFRIPARASYERCVRRAQASMLMDRLSVTKIWQTLFTLWPSVAHTHRSDRQLQRTSMQPKTANSRFQHYSHTLDGSPEHLPKTVYNKTQTRGAHNSEPAKAFSSATIDGRDATVAVGHRAERFYYSVCSRRARIVS